MIVQFILLFVLPILVSWLVTPYVIRFAHVIGALDQPNERKVHKNPTPRLGGLAIYLSFFSSLMFMFYNNSPILVRFGGFDPHKGVMLVFSLTLVLILGIWDDVQQLTPGKKFLGQFLAAVMVYFAGFRITFITHPFSLGVLNLGLLEFPFTILWIVGITNAFNLIDGLDGLASGVAVIVSLTIFSISFMMGSLGISAIALLLAGSLIGFLLFIGFCLAILSMSSSTKGSAVFSILIPILALGLPIMDTLLAMVRRFLRSLFPENAGASSFMGKIVSMFLPDRGHIHHRLIDMGFSHRTVVLLMYVVSCIFGLGAFAMTVSNNIAITPILITIGVATFVGVSQLRYKEMAVLRNGSLLPLYEWPLVNSRVFQGFLDMAFISGAYTIAYFLTFRGDGPGSFNDPFFRSLTLVAGIQMVVFYFGGLYKGTMRQRGTGDILKILKVVVIAVVLTWSVVAMFPPGWNVLNKTLIVLDFYLILSFIMGSRVSFHVLNYLSRREAHAGKKKILIYGADDNGALIIQQLLNDESHELNPVGFLDDDPQLEGKRINDYPVFGGHLKLPRLVKKLKVEEILIAKNSLKPEVMKRLMKMSQLLGVTIRAYRVYYENIGDQRPEMRPQVDEKQYLFAGK